MYSLNICSLKIVTTAKFIDGISTKLKKIVNNNHCVKGTCVNSELLLSAFFPQFLAFGLNTERYGVYGVSVGIQS